jgi:hypothetical protein
MLKLNRRKGEELLGFSVVTFWSTSVGGPFADEDIAMLRFLSSAFLDLHGLIPIRTGTDSEEVETGTLKLSESVELECGSLGWEWFSLCSSGRERECELLQFRYVQEGSLGFTENLV